MKKHSPEILTGIGIAGMIATTVSAVRATPKALQLIDAREIKENRRLSNKEIIATTWKCYVPAAVTGVLSTACLVGASSANLRRNTALATAYSISETALKEYKEKAVEVVGEKKEQAIRDAVAKETLSKHPLGEREVIITGGGDILCFDPLTNRYFKSDRDRLMRAMNELNKRMRDEMRVSLNDFYDEIGLSEAEVGEHLGWDIDNGKGYMSSGYCPFPITRVIGRLVKLLLLLRKNAKVPKIKTTGITVLRAMRVPSERIGLWNATATPV